jgi:hypothetical protein
MIMTPALKVFEDVPGRSEKLERSILYKVLSSGLNEAQKTPDAMQNEVIGNILAGTEAVGNALLTTLRTT